jgi:hypothetical protein
MVVRRLAVAIVLSFASFAAVADPAAWQREGWRTDFGKIKVAPAEIQSVIGRDGIPSIDRPAFVPVNEETSLLARDPVIGLVVEGDARAYPLRILMWHEIVNDVVGGIPVLVTYCPLCNASICFERTVEGEALDFGTTGKLRNSDLVMYDRKTESWWQQFSGQGIVGAFAGRSLKLIPSRVESWKLFREEHPDGRVLVPNDASMRAYWQNPYRGYDSSIVPFLYNGTLPEGMPALERVVLVRGEKPFAVALPVLQKAGEIREGDIVLKWEPGQASALDTTEIAKGRDVGNVTATRMVDGKPVPVVYDVTFAFVVNAFEPTVVIRTK